MNIAHLATHLNKKQNTNVNKAATILIVEDEAIVRSDIKQTLRSLGYLVIGEASNGQEAIALALRLRPDLILMDIKLRGAMTGVEAAIDLKKQSNMPVVFLTGNSDTATIQGAKAAQPYGYIIKPFQTVQMKTAIEMALHKHKADSGLAHERNTLFGLLTTKRVPDDLFIHEKGRQIRVRLEEILFVEALKDYVGIHLQDKRHVTYVTMKSIEEHIPAKDFLRIHRSFIVRVDKIDAIEGSEVILEGEKHRLPIGVTYYPAVMARFKADPF